MKRTQYLAKNTALFALNSIGTKLITFILVPLYTAVLTESDYGTADLVSTIATILVPLFTLNIGEAVMRFSLDDNADYDSIMTTGILLAVVSTLWGIILIPVCSLFKPLHGIEVFISLYCIVQGIYQVVVCYLRGTEQLTSFAITNIIHVFATAFFNIIFLLVMKWGLTGYFVSYILGYVIGIVFAVIAGKSYVYVSRLKLNRKLSAQMVRYSIVLVPTSFMWWIMNSSDRLMVSSICGLAANGIYAVSYKIPTVLSTMSTVFNQAWSYSAIKENKSEDKDNYYNLMYSYFTSFQILITGSLLFLIRPFFRIYVSANYYDAWKYTPYLLIGYLFMSLGTFLSTSYTVNKDTRGFLVSGMIGAGLNVVLNFLLIPKIGTAGAAFATCVSYISVFVYRSFDTKKYIAINVINKKIAIEIIILIFMGMYIFRPNNNRYIVLGAALMIIFIIERNFIGSILSIILRIINKRR